MIVPDWNRGDLNHQWRVVLLDPLNLKTVRGEISNVSDGKLSVDYESETLYSFTFTSHHDGYFEWDGTSAVRIIHTVNGWTEDLFTGYVTGISYDRTNGLTGINKTSGSTTASWTLSSAIYALTSDALTYTYTIGGGAKAKDVIDFAFQAISKTAYTIEPTALDYKFGSAIAYGLQSTWYSIVSDMCLLSKNEITVDGSGTIIIRRYVSNKQKTSEFTLQTVGSKANTIGTMRVSDQSPSIPSKYVVVARNDDVEIAGYFTRGSDDKLNPFRRGYCLTEFYEVDDLVPFTVDQATLRARELAESESTKKDRSVSSMYLPLKAGTIVNYSDNFGIYKNYVKNGDLDLNNWTWSLTITEV